MPLANLSTTTSMLAIASTLAWTGLLVACPSIAKNARLAVTLNTLSAFLFVLYLEEDPDLTSNKRYVVSSLLPGVSGKTVGAIFIVLMLAVYLWLAYSLSKPSS